ncbi:protealysin inhibitor emfourin [Halomonas sp. MA07-2]|uniref:protealysin inhibitor emfourin n=1 Tax=unclassified Halomonas TaxID=2609666 RepID=UPI003EECC34D
MTARPPQLTAASVLRLCREGGVAHFPGLARPRRIDCGQCSEAQRDELHRLLANLDEARVAGADRRQLRLSVEDAGRVIWSRNVTEELAPPALWRWWRQAEVEEDRE